MDNNLPKKRKAIELEILDDIALSGVYELALVEKPAHESNWMAFKSEEFVKPSSGERQSEFIPRCMSVLVGDEGKPEDQAAAICYSMWDQAHSFYAEFAEYPWDKCIADQKDKGLNEESANRLCGWIKANMSYDVSALPPYVDETEDKEKSKQKFEGEVIDILGFKPDNFEMCPRLQEIFAHLVSMNPDTDTEGKIRSAALQADRILDIEEDVLENGIATMDQLKEATVFASDFIDLMEEIDARLDMEHDVEFILTDHLSKIVQLFPDNEPIKMAAVENPEFNEDAVLETAKRLGKTNADFEKSGYKFAKYNPEDKLMPLQFAKGYTVYKYEGPITSNSRRFCREMVGMEKFYTFAEVEAMGKQAYNPGFGKGGSSTYSIWKYKGGANCKHGWQKYYVDETGKYQNKGKAPGTPGQTPYDMPNQGYVEKMSAFKFATEEGDEQIIVGAAIIPDIDIVRKDPKTGELYYVTFTKDSVKRIAEKFMRENRLHYTNVDHDTEDNAFTYVMESWIVETPEDKANSVYKLNVPVGTWCVKMRVTDSAVWKQVKEGKLNGVSIEGEFMSSEERDAFLKERDKYKKILNILNS